MEGMKWMPRYIQCLLLMRENDDELVYERGEAYVSLEKFSGATVFKLLRMCAIRHDQYSGEQGGKGLERYTINETGLNILKQWEDRNAKINPHV